MPHEEYAKKKSTVAASEQEPVKVTDEMIRYAMYFDDKIMLLEKSI